MTYTAEEQGAALAAASDILFSIDPATPVWVQVSSNAQLTLHLDPDASAEEADQWLDITAAQLAGLHRTGVEENDPASGASYDARYRVATLTDPINGWKVSISAYRRATVTA